MEAGDLITLDERESSGWVDSWTEYLCLKEIPEGFELSIRSHEILAEAMEYVDEEGEDLELPDKINGKSVYCRDGDFIIGEVLVVRPDTDCGEESMGSIKFKDALEENVKSFLQCLGWYEEEILSEIKAVTKK